MAWLTVEGLGKRFENGVAAVVGLDLTVRDGEFVTIVGPSGSGKTTLLRLIAGLDSATRGQIQIGDVDVTRQPPRRRDVAMVFQNPALFPHLSVFDNLAFGLRARGVDREEIRERINVVAEMLDIGILLDRWPETLSGGQRQRVALGRALVRRPAIFLLDEPLSGLDGPLRAAVRTDLIDLHRKHGATILHVTHDQGEALAMSDRVGVMDGGRLAQIGRPREIYDHPGNRFVAGFIGHPPMNLVGCEILPGDGPVRLRFDGFDEGLALAVPNGPMTPVLAGYRGKRLELGLRPERIALARLIDTPSPAYSWWPIGAEVERVEFQGSDTLVAFRMGPHHLAARLPKFLTARPADRFVVGLDLLAATWFDPETGRAMAVPSSQ